MDKLLQLGFLESAHTSIQNDRLNIDIIKNENASNILYAFVEIEGEDVANWNVFYIGHTRKTFQNRMYGFQLGNGKAVNNRVHNTCIDFLKNKKQVVIYCMVDHFNMCTNNLYIDIAAGLEYSLISYYKDYNEKYKHPPLLNIAGNDNYVRTNETSIDILEKEEKNEENETYIVIEPINSDYTDSFNYVLNSTYWESPFINIPTKFSSNFGEHQETVTLHIFENSILIKSITSNINRNAVKNGTPRLFFKSDDGKWFQEWKHKNYNEGASIEIGIPSENTLIIEK